MNKTLKIIVFGLAFAFLAIQFYRPNRTAPPIVEAETLEASAEIPESVNEIFKRVCHQNPVSVFQ